MSESPTKPRSKMSREVERCPSCESPRIRVVSRADRFQYGTGKEAVELTATVPMFVCDGCGLEYTDETGERSRQEAVCRHLGVLTPREIVSIRERHGLSRRQFAAATRIGLASLSRWEAASGEQNPAMDIYLRLLADPAVLDRVKRFDFVPPGPRDGVQPTQFDVAESAGAGGKTANIEADGLEAPKFDAFARLDTRTRIRLERGAVVFALDQPRAVA